MDSESEDSSLIEEDYYAFLNVPRDASNEDITNAYRRLSRLYHPDKHFDPELKKEAELIFNKTKKAYEVLSDPHQRAIYDSLGVRGLQTEGWEIVQRTRTPQEIREEYERLAREREQRRLEQRTNPKGSVTLSINATDLFSSYEDEYEDIEEGWSLPAVEVSGMVFSQSVEAPLTLRDTARLAGQLSAQNGVGAGSVTASLRHLLSEKGWVEAEASVGGGPALGLKGFRSFGRRTFASLSAALQFGALGVRPGLTASVATQLGRHTVGDLTWRAGLQSSMSTALVRSTPSSHVALTLQLGVPHSFVSLGASRRVEALDARLRSSVKVGTFGALLEYGAEKKLSQHSTVAASVILGVPTGVTLKIKLTRASQSYVFPVHLSEELLPSAVFYATVTPVVAWAVLKRLVVDPVLREQRRRDKEKQQELNKTRLQEQRREARAAVDLMRATYARVRADEEARRGLVVSAAWHGRMAVLLGLKEQAAGRRALQPGETEVVDVTVPLQCLVKDSRLELHDAPKSQLPGFYDPCMGEEKMLLVEYLFHGHLHEACVSDTEPLRIPKQAHRVNPS
ncbi:dnaJ homolog subfamily C member 11 [Bacillus rossius redtenbacheri]|uniref:dnaJ homolog subfamily C member 11 n=1 Tax=Bacillus rossius redtenbacheri TaxID=93214 RepID=UPI002FDEBC2F